jgi:hypothetical protein
VALGLVLLQVLQFLPVSIFAPMLHIQSHSVHIGFLVDKVALELPLEFFFFFFSSCPIIPPLLYPEARPGRGIFGGQSGNRVAFVTVLFIFPYQCHLAIAPY